jgi:hypothetical protein
MDMSKDFFVGDGWSPTTSVLETDFPEWVCKQTVYQTDKKKQIYLDGHTFNLPVESRSIVFRWLMPKKPNIYSPEWEVPEDYRMASVMRFTIGEWFGLTEDDLKEVRESRVSIPRERLSQISKMLEKSFLFNGLKIPYIEVRWDSVSEIELNSFINFHVGKMGEQALFIANNIRDAEFAQKKELLGSALSTLQSKPAYLSILRDVVEQRISIETAIEMTGNSGVFQKGV